MYYMIYQLISCTCKCICARARALQLKHHMQSHQVYNTTWNDRNKVIFLSLNLPRVIMLWLAIFKVM
jgi:hypothetical protein